MLRNMVIGRLRKMTKGLTPDFVNGVIRRAEITDYESFCDALMKDIDQCIRLLENGKNQVHKMSEDQITFLIITQLKQCSYDASQDTEYGGHVDISVKYGEYTWLGEAKIMDKGYSNNHIWEGFLQLTTRYANARENQDHGGLLIYIFKPNAKKIMDDWKSYLENKNSNDLKILGISTCDLRSLAFYTVNEDPQTGLNYTVRHIPAAFNFDPKDKSGKKRKNK